MIFLLLGLTASLLIFYMLANKRGVNFCEPVFLYLAATLVSILFVIANYNNWNVDKEFSQRTVLIIFSSEVLLLFGSISARVLYASLPKHKKKIYYEAKPICISRKMLFFSIAFVISSGAFYFIDLFRKSSLPFTGFISYMTLIRPMLKNNEISIGFLSIQLFNISKILAYLFTYIYIWNLVRFKSKNKRYLLIPTIYILISLLTSGRIYFIYYVIFSYTLYFLLLKKYIHFSLVKILKIIIGILAFLILIFVLFADLANIVGRNTSHTVFVQLSVYIGGPLVSFNKFINEFSILQPTYFGEETLIGIYQILGKVGITKITLNRHLEFIQFGNNWGNVYTAMRRYIHDYGIGVALFIVFILGFLYEFFYDIVSKRTYLSIRCILYAMWIYPIPMMIIDDLFISNLLGINTCFDLFYLLVLYKVLIPPNYIQKIN